MLLTAQQQRNRGLLLQHSHELRTVTSALKGIPLAAMTGGWKLHYGWLRHPMPATFPGAENLLWLLLAPLQLHLADASRQSAPSQPLQSPAPTGTFLQHQLQEPHVDMSKHYYTNGVIVTPLMQGTAQHTRCTASTCSARSSRGTADSQSISRDMQALQS